MKRLIQFNHKLQSFLHDKGIITFLKKITATVLFKGVAKGVF